MQPFSQLLSELQRLCAERCTGFVVIRPSGARLARLTLERGEIVFVSFQEKTGVDALPMLAAVESGRLDFIKGLGGTTKIPLPSTDEILARLAVSVAPHGYAVGKLETGSSDVAADALDPKARSVLEATLADYIGPMASIVCQGGLIENKDLETAIESLAKEIPDPENGRKFVEEVRARLV